jgi:hypothetical protein
MTDYWRAHAEFLPETFTLVQKQKHILLKDTTAYLGTFWQG